MEQLFILLFDRIELSIDLYANFERILITSIIDYNQLISS